MPLRQSTLDVLKKLGARLPSEASTIAVTALVSKTRWPDEGYRPVVAAKAMRLVPFLVANGARPCRSRRIPYQLLPPKLRNAGFDTGKLTSRELAMRVWQADVAALVPDV